MQNLLLDYDLGQHRTSGYPDAREVSRIVGELVEHYGELLSENTLIALRSLAEQLSRAKDCRIAASRADRHPLATAGGAAPIYAALHPDGDDRYAQCERVISPLAVPRLVLLISWTQPDAISFAALHRLSNACRNWSRSGNPVERAELAAGLSPLIRSHEWRTAIGYLSEQRDHYTGPLAQRCDDFIAAIRLAEKLLPNPDAESRTPKTATISTANDNSGFTALFDEECAGEHGGVWIAPAGSTSDADTPRRHDSALAQYGRRLALQRRWGMVSDEALPPPQARVAVDWLITELPQANGYTYLAMGYWLLAAVTGHRIDALIAASQELAVDVYPELRLRCTEHEYVLNVPHIHRQFLPAGPDDQAPPTHTDFDLALPPELPLSDMQTRLSEGVIAIGEAEALGALVEALQVVRAALRSLVPGLTESSLRGALIQTVLRARLDLPLCQLLFAQRCLASLAPLHYIVWTQSSLQEAFNGGLTDLYGQRFTAVASPDPDRQVGAALATEAVGAMQRFATRLSSSRTHRPACGLERLVQDHNRLCDHVAMMLLVATAGRNHRDYQRLTARQVSVSARCLIYADKPTDPAIYRRLCVFPAIVADALTEYHYHLQQLIGRLKQSDAVPANTTEHIQFASDGKAPLFFQLEIRDRTVHQNTWDGRRRWADTQGDSLRPNAARHAMATFLRRERVPAIWIEAQLGHAAEVSLFGELGSLAPIEFARLMDQPLERFLHYAGFETADRTPHHAQQTWWPNHARMPVAALLCQQEAAAFAEDRQRTTRLWQADNQLTKHSSIDDAIDCCLSAVVEGYTATKPPRHTELGIQKVREVADRLGKRGSVPLARTLTKGVTMAQRSVHVQAKKIQFRVQARSG